MSIFWIIYWVVAFILSLVCAWMTRSHLQDGFDFVLVELVGCLVLIFCPGVNLLSLILALYYAFSNLVNKYGDIPVIKSKK